MKTKMKKFTGVMLTLTLVLGLLPGMALMGYADGETETATLPTSPGNYILTADVTVNKAWHPVDGITLNLGGHRITQTGTNHDDGSVIVIESGRTFTMTGTGTLTGGIGSNEGTYYVGGGVMVLGTFNMKGGTITGNSASGGNGDEGGGVWVGNGGTFNMYDGAITNNTGAGGGVGIGVNGWNNSNTPGTFNMYGGSISGNSSSYAAGVRLNNGTFNMQGGTITGGGSNFDIRVDKDGASRNVFNLSGNVTIGSIRFDGEMKANIAGSITNDSAIIVYMDKARVFTNSSNVAYNEAGRFTSGIDNYVVLKNSDGQLYLGNETNYAMSFDCNGGSGNMTTEYVVAGGTYSLPNCRFTAPANMTFKAWSYNGTEYDAGQSFTNVSGNMTFTAVWKNTALVTYKVENGTWADGTTTDQTETVTSGSKPANVPTGMKATEGYTGGAWNTDPTTATITEATTFTYTFEAVPTYTVTYKVVNGTWSDGTMADISETVASGENPIKVPTGMKAAEGYTGGAWNADPAAATITEATTFTYTFDAESAAVVKEAPKAKDDLTNTGSPQELVTGGTAEGGTMQYAIGTSATTPPTEGWSTAIPTGTEAGTYYVWYKAVGDGTHTDSTPVCITVKIEGVTYTATDGEHTISDGKDAAITVKREPDDSKTYDLYTGAQVDGKDLPEGSHTTAKGSLILTLKAAYLDTLTVGDHKVTIAFEDGSATATIKIKEAAPAPTATPKPVPKTGDGSNPALWLGLAVAGLILIAGTVILWNRKKRCGK